MRPALVFFLLFNCVYAQEARLRIDVLEGQDAVNNVNQPIAREPAVRVLDAAGKSVEGATVVFALPSVGVGGIFPNGTNTLTVTTDRDGRAVARGIRFRQTGKFQIRVSASYQGQTASILIDQTNISGVSSSKGPSSKVWIIVAVAAGAAAGGIFAATHGGGSSSSSSAPIVITPGTPTVGGPR